MNSAMPELLLLFIDSKLFQSAILLIVMSLVRTFLIYLIKRNSAILSEAQRLWLARAKNIIWFIILVGLFTVWWPELRNFALSIAAVAVAVVIATKELILCFSGALMRAGSGAFSIGDWVEVGSYRGEVIDYNMFSTTLQELDRPPNHYEFTGKTILIPNSIFLSKSVKNLNFSKRYVFHRFDIVIEPVVNVYELYEWVFEEINGFSSEFVEVARRYNAFIEKRTGIDIPSAEPRVIMSTNEQAKHVISVIVFCPAEKATKLEQHVTRGVMGQVYQKIAVGRIKE